MIVASTTDRRTVANTLVLDITTTEEVEFASEVSAYPTEVGTIISDHITLGAKTVRIGGIVGTADVSAFAFTDNGEPKVVDILETLERLHNDRSVLTIATGQMVYRDMAFTRLRAVRTADSGGGNFLQIEAEATKIRMVSLKTAEVPAETVRSSDPAAGRAGETNKAAGRTSSNATGTGGGSSTTSRAGAQQPGAAPRGRSAAAALVDALKAAP